MTTIIGEYAVTIQKTDIPREYRFYAVPTQGADLNNRRGFVWADDADDAEQEVKILLEL